MPLRKRHALLSRLRQAWGRPPSRRSSASDLEALREVFRSQWLGSAILSAQTCRDLLLDDVFVGIDSTLSGLGRQALYDRLRLLPSARDREEFERLVGIFGAEPSRRERIQSQLARLEAAPTGLWQLTRPETIPFRPWYILFPVLLLAVIAAALAIAFWPRALLVLFGLLAIGIGLRAVLYWHSAHVLYPLRQLGPVIDVAGALVREDGLVSPDERRPLADSMAAIAALRPVLRWIGRDPLMTGELVGLTLEYLNMLLLLDANAMFFTARRLRRHSGDLARVLSFVGRVDTAQSVASLRARPSGWCVPRLQGSRTSGIRDAWHPLLAMPVANSITLEGGRGLLVTGSNMSGKSTMLRTVGLAAVLARSINTCPAAAYEGSLFTVTSCMQTDDDLMAGRSTYLVQAEIAVGMLAIRRDAAPHLFILDELFRGTNTIERISAGEAFLRELLAPPDGGESPHAVVAATHDGELVPLLADIYLPVHFGEDVVDGELVFDHRLRPGPARTKSALRLLALLGAPQAMLDAAHRRVGELEARRQGS